MPKGGIQSPKKGHESGETETGGERAEKFSRSTIACNGCRARKQKCGGEKPICLRCRKLDKPCIWPEQLKRGPAKGYNESLEQRLHETESMLLSVLGVLSDEQLFNISFSEVPERNLTPSAADKRLKLEEWAKFPLRSRENLLVWRSGRWRNPADGELSLGTRTAVGGVVSENRMAGVAMEVEAMHQQMYNTGGVGIHQPGADDQTNYREAAAIENYIPPVENGKSKANFRSSGAIRKNGSLRMSKEFQDKFLW